MPREPVASEPTGTWLDTAAAARHLGREPGTLRGWRSLGRGPAFHLVSGQFVRYRLDNLDAFLKSADQVGNPVKPPRAGAEK